MNRQKLSSFDVSFSRSLLEPLGRSLYKVNGISSKLLFYNVMQYIFSSGALKQIKIGLWDADDATFALKCQKGVQKSFKTCIFVTF